jgi:hypothetical protein
MYIQPSFWNAVLEKISWTDSVRNEEVLHGAKKDRNILHKIKSRNANWIGYILRRNCLTKHIIERKIRGNKKGKEGRRRRCKR